MFLVITIAIPASFRGMAFAPADFIFGAVAAYERHPFCHMYLLYRSGSVSTVIV